MKLHVQYALILGGIIAFWCGLQYNRGNIASEIVVWYVDVFPLYCLMTFGSYCLFKLGYDLFTFNDYPDEINKLADVSCIVHVI